MAIDFSSIEAANWKNPNNWHPRGLSNDAVSITNEAARDIAVALCRDMGNWLRGLAPQPDMQIVAKALKFNIASVASIAAIAIPLLLERDPEVATTLRKIARSAPARSRGILLHNLSQSVLLDRKMVRDLLFDSLRDRSSFVRAFAVESLARSPTLDPEVLLRIKDLQRTERNPVVMASLGWVVPALEGAARGVQRPRQPADGTTSHLCH